MTTYTNDFSGALGGTIVVGSPAIVSGQLGFGNNDNYWVAGAAAGNDQFSEVVVDFVGGGKVGTTVRGSNAALTCYAADVDNNGTLTINEWSAGSATQLYSSGFGGFSDGDTLRLESIWTGSTNDIEVLRNGVSFTTLSDATLTGSYVGIYGWVFEFGGTSNFVDNFSGGDLGGAPPARRVDRITRSRAAFGNTHRY